MADRENFGLCLSGGGFRATLYHLGVVRLLRDAGQLEKVTHICSVSGGSILAAHLVLNWERYNGAPEKFEEAAEEVVRLVRSDLRGQVVRTWLLTWLVGVPRLALWLRRRQRWRITNLLESRYAEFLRRRPLAALADGAGRLPDLHLLSTSMTTGHLCSFSRDGFTSDDGRGPARQIASAELPVSLAVAASSAFPPLFPPVALTREMLQCEEREFPHTEYLADGGVYDNLGVRKLLLLGRGPVRFDSVLVSDAGSKLDTQTGNAFTFVFGRSIRASDLLMMRVGDLEYMELEEMKQAGRPRVSYCRIQDVLTGRGEHVLTPERQRALKGVRTDLDRFEAWEIKALVQHGYATARRALLDGAAADTLPHAARGAPWFPYSVQKESESASPGQKEFDRAKRHRPRLWDARDWKSWASLAVVLVFAAAAALPFYLASRAEVARAAAERGKAAADEDRAKAVQGLLNVATTDSAPASGGGRESVLATLGSIFEDYKQAVVKISFTSGDSKASASGFFVHPDGFILTADYVVGTEQTPERGRATAFRVTTSDGAERPAELVAFSNSERVALLKIEARAHQSLGLAASPPPEGAPVMTAGYFEGRSLLPEVGVVSRVTEGSLYLVYRGDERGGSPGVGGGPVVNAAGEAVGVFYASSRGAGAQSECVRADVARRFIRFHLPSPGGSW